MPRLIFVLLFLVQAASAAALETPPTHLGNVASPPGGFDRVIQMAQRSDGRVYVADSYHNRVVVFDPDGRYLEQIGSPGAALGQFGVLGGIAVDPSGNIYVAEQSADRITKLSPTHLPLMTIGSSGTGPGQVRGPDNLTVSPDGSRLFVSEIFGDRVSVFDTDGNFILSFGSQGAGPGQLDHPAGIAVDQNGDIYVADQYNHRVQRFSSTGTFLSQWGGYGSALGQFIYNPSISFTSDGNFLVTDQLNNRVQKLTKAGTPLAVWGSSGSGLGQMANAWAAIELSNGKIWVGDTFNYRVSIYGYGSALATTLDPETAPARPEALLALDTDAAPNDGVLSTSCALALPTHLRDITGFDRVTQLQRREDGRIYVADEYHHRVVVYGSDGMYLEQFGSFGSALGQFNVVGGLAFGADGSLFVANQAGDNITKLSPTHLPLFTFGSSGTGPGQIDGPDNITASPDGSHIYVTELFGGRVSEFGIGGNFVNSFGSPGSGTGQFDHPAGIVTNDAGDVFVADQYNHRIQRYTAGGSYLTSWGSLGSGPGQFNLVVGLELDAEGNLYATDQLNNRVQKFLQDGTPLLQWGSFGNGPGQFYNPWAVLPLPNGEIWVADTYNYRLSIFGPGTIPGGQIVSVTDIPNDDGYQVRINFLASPLDIAGSATPILQYEAYRRIDATAPQAEASASAVSDGARPDRSPLIAGWEYVGAVPAHGESEYNLVAPTVVNSRRHHTRYSVFFIRAATSQPTLFHDSCPDSGDSRDNHPPHQPLEFEVAGRLENGDPILAWAANDETDLMDYALYRGTSAGFEPDEAHRVAEITTTNYVDQGAGQSMEQLFYKLAARDIAENESECADAMAQSLLDAGGALMPLAFALHASEPNPMMDRATFRFDLPKASAVSLEVFDLNGRLIRVIGAVGRLEAGSHRWSWDRRDQAGRRVPSGVYFYRLVTPAFEKTRRTVVTG